MMLRRGLPTLLLTGLLLTASVLALRWPDLRLAGEFFGGGYPSIESAIAVASLLCYAAVTVVAVITVTEALRAASVIQRERRRTAQAAMFLLAGAIVLALSITQRTISHPVFCCGDSGSAIQEAASLAR